MPEVQRVARVRNVIHVTPRELATAQEFLLSARGLGRPALVVTDKGARLILPAELIDLFSGLLHDLVLGRSLRIEPLPEQLTTTQAAALLGISRPTLMKRVRDGRLPATKVGTHHRIATRDVLSARSGSSQEPRRAAGSARRR